MNGTHPTADQLDRYRRRIAEPAELLEVDAHLASCDACHAAIRDRHLTYEETEAWVDGAREAAVTDHLAICELCRNEAADLAKMRDAVAAAPRRMHWRWIAAAAAAIVVLIVLFRTRPAPPPPHRPTPPPQVATLARPAILDALAGEPRQLRSMPAARTFALLAPVATVVVDDRPTFRWARVVSATSYTVAVVDAESGNVVATGSTTATEWRPPAALSRGHTYSWQVTADTRIESILSPGPSQPEALFRVSEPFALPATPRERGIAFANRGALDDAERELANAHADDLLQQIRGWRQRALPTTTNGAQ